jgi:4-hydroxyphenylacetate 3-monooxygenase
LASRFDEDDAVLYFDDVKVPWDRVFVSRNIAMCQKQFHATPAHVFRNYQSQIRLMVKMRFLVGIARRIAETNGVVNFPQVRELLGSLAAQNTMVDALVHSMELKGRMHGAYFVPDTHTLCPSLDSAALCACHGHPSRTRWRRHDQAAVLHSRLCKLRVKAWRFDR